MVVDKENGKVGKGHIVYIPPKSIHGLLNDGKEDIRFITISVDLSGDILEDMQYLA